MSSPGYRTTRYWLTFDRADVLKAHLVKGTGSVEATEEETLVALGEVIMVKDAPRSPPRRGAAPMPAAATHRAQDRRETCAGRRARRVSRAAHPRWHRARLVAVLPTRRPPPTAAAPDAEPSRGSPTAEPAVEAAPSAAPRPSS